MFDRAFGEIGRIGNQDSRAAIQEGDFRFVHTAAWAGLFGSTFD